MGPFAFSYIYIYDIEDNLSSYIYIYVDYTYLFATGTDPTKTENIPNSDLIEIKKKKWATTLKVLFNVRSLKLLFSKHPLLKKIRQIHKCLVMSQQKVSMNVNTLEFTSLIHWSGGSI